MYKTITLFFCLAVCVLISVSAPNSGAIIRYRSLVVVFLFLAETLLEFDKILADVEFSEEYYLITK